MIDIGKQYFMCDECKLCKDWERRLAHAKEYGNEFQYDHCFCEKIDAEFCVGGYCEDAFSEKKIGKNKHGVKRGGIAYRRSMTAKKKKRLYHIATSSAYPHSRYAKKADRKYLKYKSKVANRKNEFNFSALES